MALFLHVRICFTLICAAFRKTWIPESDRCVCGATRFIATANQRDYIQYLLENFTPLNFARTLRLTVSCQWSLLNRFVHGWEPINLVNSLLKAKIESLFTGAQFKKLPKLFTSGQMTLGGSEVLRLCLIFAMMTRIKKRYSTKCQ